METINNLLLEKYNSLMSQLLIGYPLNKKLLTEIKCLIHVLHFIGFDNESKERLEILAYYE